MVSKITAGIRHLHPVQIIRDIFIPFTITMFVLYSMMFIIPSVEPFRPKIIWPLGFLDWYIDFLTLQFMNPENPNFSVPWIGEQFSVTLKFLLGSLALSAVLVLALLLWHFTYPNRFLRFLVNLLRVSSGLHVLVLVVVFYLLGIRPDNPLDLRLLFILALGNGSLIELYYTLEAEFEKILRKEYVLAGEAWGYPRFLFPLRELTITTVEYLSARIPILLSSTIIVEHVTSLDGISRAIVTHIENRDFQGILVVSGLISFIIIFANVISERIRFWLDPRVRYAASTG